MNVDLAINNPLPYARNIGESVTGSSSYSTAKGFAQTGHYPFEMPLASQAAHSILQADYLSNHFVSFGGLNKFSTTLENRKYLLLNLDYIDSKQKIEGERINRLSLEMAESINFRAADNNELIKLIGLRIQDKSLNKILNLIARLSPLSQTFEFTEDFSIYFTINFLNRTLYLEFFLERSDEEPDFVYLLYNGDECVNTGRGGVDLVSNKLLRLHNLW